MNAIGFELEAFIVCVHIFCFVRVLLCVLLTFCRSHSFSIDTFANSLDPTLFAPPSATLNVSQWVEIAISMGARVAALTSKHEKGFCLWPSKYR